MNEVTQDYKNHARFHPPFHFFLAPIMAINLIYCIVQFFRTPTWDRGEMLLLSLALFVMAALVRTNPLRAQDRLIRLEERLRFQRVLSPDLAAKAEALTPSQTVALRFASDAELPTLIPQILSGKLTKSAEIKKAVVNWRGDYFRV